MPINVDGRVATFDSYPCQRSLQRSLLANASFADLKARRNTDTTSFLRGNPRISAGNGRFGVCSRIVAVFVTRVKCLQHRWGKVSTNMVLRKMLVPWWRSFHWENGFIPAISGVKTNDLEQLMR